MRLERDCSPSWFFIGLAAALLARLAAPANPPTSTTPTLGPQSLRCSNIARRCEPTTALLRSYLTRSPRSGGATATAAMLPMLQRTASALGRRARIPAWGDCRQCHVEQLASQAFQQSDLAPLWWPASGSRLYPSAPPTIPHHLQNREECAVCHIGQQAPAALRAEHGMRANCVQCHVPMLASGGD